MKKTRTLNGLLAAALCLLLCAAPAFAAAAGSICVRLTDGDDLPVSGAVIVMNHVADADGALTARFVGAGISADSLLDSRDVAKNSKALSEYAEQWGIAGQEKSTDSDGRVEYTGLSEGIYLVRCQAGQKVTFPAFLVYIPTVINGVEIYDVQSEPKAEDAPDPEPTPSVTPGPSTSPDPSPSPSADPSPSVEPSPSPTVEPSPSPSVEPSPSPSPSSDPSPSPDPGKPDLPQTGVRVWPMYLLLGLGALFIVAGLIDLCANRRKRDE